MLGFDMEANNKTKDDGSAESPTSVLEDEVRFVFFALFGSRDYEGKWRLGKQKGNRKKFLKKKKKSEKEIA